ncbi:MAG: hypothetical protein CMB99_02830 [Flavobacteriaceae bacterium]|nr:hypothetical protein [Flavobacteriaceae bacterium]|tara:strand:- start:143043 stop:143759 length:717 start_codon:yes stop_codon:yes gene_type:complete
MKTIKFTCILLLTLCTISACNSIQSGEDVIKAMHDKYEGQWYPHLTFAQNVYFYKGDTIQREQIWWEAITLGEGLIIKFDSISSDAGYLFRNDSLYVYNQGAIVNRGPRVHDALELGFNVYGQPADTTISKLKSAGFDFSKLDEDERYYIIGDPTKKQVWIEKERLLFYKIKTTAPNGMTSGVEFHKYEKLGKTWISPEVLFFNNGKMTMKETYFDMKIPDSLPSDLFSKEGFQAKTW